MNTLLTSTSILPYNEYSNDMSSVSYNILSSDELKINRKSHRRRSYAPKPYTIVSYGPINVRVIHGDTPNLKTGRLSKFIPLEGEEAKQREVRRYRKREAARKIQEKRRNIEDNLLNDMTQLETKEKQLAQDICNLQSYKSFLEKLCQEKLFDKSALTVNTSQIEYNQQEIQRDFPSPDESKPIITNSRPSSPPWQLVFSI